LGGLKARIWVLLDGCPPAYERLFTSCFAAEDLELVRLPGVGNFRTFEMQVDLLARQEAAELVYFAEDDYFYLPGGLELMAGFLRDHDDVDFVSPYDHLDYYTLGFHRHPGLIRGHGGRHWRTVNSTCLTFLTTRSTLGETRRVFERYARVKLDCSLWLSLTKERLKSPLRILSFLRSDPFFFLVVRKAWSRCWRQILFGRRFQVWVPMPSIATHMHREFLAPAVDWQARFGVSRG
jgi:hypothetical protein